MSSLELLIDFHLRADRQGPGSEADTLRALSFIAGHKAENFKIADIGCGTGSQTLTLAQHTRGQITAVDLFPQFLDQLKQRADHLGLRDRIVLLEKSMDELPFEEHTFDLIWSEGAIYNIGFETGVKKWRPFLKPGAHLAVSEITWITSNRPPEIENFWQQEYPEIDTPAAKFSILEAQGYTPVAYFTLPPDSWLKNYYEPIEARFATFLKQHQQSEIALDIVAEYQEEIDLYKRYKDYYSYGFYLARKV